MEQIISDLCTLEVRFRPMVKETPPGPGEPRLMHNFYQALVNEREHFQYYLLRESASKREEVLTDILITIAALPRTFPKDVVDAGLDYVDESLASVLLDAGEDHRMMIRCVLLLVYLDAFYRTQAEEFLIDGKEGGMERFLGGMPKGLAQQLRTMKLWDRVQEEQEDAFLRTSLSLRPPPGYGADVIAFVEREAAAAAGAAPVPGSGTEIQMRLLDREFYASATAPSAPEPGGAGAKRAKMQQEEAGKFP